MNTEIYEKNLRAIGNWVDTWEDYIKNEKYMLDPEYVIEKEEAQTGEVIFYVNDHEGRKLYLSGKYNPAQGIKDWMEKEKIKKHNSVIVVLGMGDCIEIKEMIRETSSDTYILIYEPFQNAFIKAVQEIDLQEIFQEKRVGIAIEGMNEKEWEGLLGTVLTLENITLVHVYINRNYQELFPQKIQGALAKVKKEIDDLQVRWRTKIRYTVDKGINIIHNAKYLLNERAINAVYHVLPEKFPCIIVAAGPSLNKNIEDLKMVQKRACIIACDTALKPLLSHGITPDFFVIVDAKKPKYLIDYPGAEKIPFVTSLDSPNNIMEFHKGKKLFYYERSLFEKKIVDKGFRDRKKPVPIQEGVSGLKTGGSVATSAYSFAEFLGSKTIILVGQDLAFTGNKSHADGTFAKEMEEIEGIEDFPIVLDIHGEQIHTASDMLLYLRWYEDEFRKHPDYEIIDATEGGALIAGTKVMSLKEAIETYCGQKIDIQRHLKDTKPIFRENERMYVKEYFRQIPIFAEETLTKIQETRETYRELVELSNKNNVGKEIQEISKKLAKQTDALENNEIYQLMVGFMAGFEYTFRASIYQDDNENELETIAKQGENYLNNMAYILDNMIPLLSAEFEKEIYK